METSFQLMIAYDMIYYVKFTALSIKTGCNFSFQCNKSKKKFLFKQERDSYSSFNRVSFVTFVTAKVTI